MQPNCAIILNLFVKLVPHTSKNPSARMTRKAGNGAKVNCNNSSALNHHHHHHQGYASPSSRQLPPVKLPRLPPPPQRPCLSGHWIWLKKVNPQVIIFVPLIHDLPQQAQYEQLELRIAFILSAVGVSEKSQFHPWYYPHCPFDILWPLNQVAMSVILRVCVCVSVFWNRDQQMWQSSSLAASSSSSSYFLSFIDCLSSSWVFPVLALLSHKHTRAVPLQGFLSSLPSTCAVDKCLNKVF